MPRTQRVTARQGMAWQGWPNRSGENPATRTNSLIQTLNLEVCLPAGWLRRSAVGDFTIFSFDGLLSLGADSV